MGPRGSARAAEPLDAPAPTTSSRTVERGASRLSFSGERGEYSVKTLAPRRGSIDQLEEDVATTAPQREEKGLPADMSDLLGSSAHRQYMNKGFLFSEGLTELTPLQEELDELDDYIRSNKDVARFKGVVSVGTTGLFIFGALRTMQWAETVFILKEKKEIAAEMDLTGMYIAIDAGKVEGAVDPKTGKNITVSGADKIPSADQPGELGAADGAEKAKQEEAPWLLRVLGLGDAASADDDSFWEDKRGPPPKPKGPSGKGGAAAEEAGEEGEEGEDTDGIDTLEDLLG